MVMVVFYSPGDIFDGSFVQDLDTDHVPSRRRNPVIADIFSRMNYMERRGSGFKKIKDDYRKAVNYRPELEPKFYSDATSFLVTLYNLNYNVPIDAIGVEAEKQSLEDEKTVVSNQKQLFEEKVNALRMSKHTKARILKLYEDIGVDCHFSRADIMRIIGITSSPAGDLIKKMKNENLVESVVGKGKGKYRFSVLVDERT